MQSVETSCAVISNRLESLSLEQAWTHGTNVQTAMRHNPKLTFATMLALLMDAIEYLDFNKTITKEDDFIHAVRHLLDEFPTMKLEEWKVMFDRLKAGSYGKMYERLKLPELVEIFKQHEGERAEFMERQITRQKDVPPPIATEAMTLMLKKLADDLNLPSGKSEREKWKDAHDWYVNEYKAQNPKDEA